jgi:hypothetical protein
LAAKRHLAVPPPTFTVLPPEAHDKVPGGEKAKVTAPVGVPEPGAWAVTVALKVTVWPAFMVGADEVRTSVVDAGPMTWPRSAELALNGVLPSNPVSTYKGE